MGLSHRIITENEMAKYKQTCYENLSDHECGTWSRTHLSKKIPNSIGKGPYLKVTSYGKEENKHTRVFSI